MNVLIIDAHQSRRSELVDRMRDFDGSDVVCFSDGNDALAWSRDHTPDCIVFTDEVLGMNPLDFFRSFRDMRRESIPAILAGADLARDVRHRALALGVAEILIEPLDYAEFPIRVSNLVALRAFNREQSVTADWLAGQVSRATSMIREREREIILRLSHLAEYRNAETTQHIVRVAQICEAIARGAGLGSDVAETLLLAAPMHDIGKVAIPDYLFQKRGKLTGPEVELMKQHTTIGYEILSGSTAPLLQAAAEIALTHHEKYDGSGYPRGLKGTNIPLSGRICALADAFDAMTMNRPYKPAADVEASVLEIERCSGRHFDPMLVGAFKAEFPSIREIKRRLVDEPLH